jgi:adenine-specific DNA-methyltransferase
MRQRIDRGAPTRLAKAMLARQLRQEATPAERYAWSLLRDRRILGLKFRRQHVIGGFIVDFYCAELRLVLELDGAPHEHEVPAAYDAERTRHLEATGLRVIRLRNRDVSPGRLARLLAQCARPNRTGRAPASPLST